MLSQEIMVLSLTAMSIGFLHTVFGPDHYIPFIAMSKARMWSLRRTVLITILCGLGHVMSSVILGIIGIVFGVAVMRLEAFEAYRGSVAAWLLIGFGFAYFLWGLNRAFRNIPHAHSHAHEDEHEHEHEHVHTVEHAHIHSHRSKRDITPWILFTIFAFGPCEPLIPVLMYPAAKSSIAGMVIVATLFSAVTIATMVGIVMALSSGLRIVPLGRLERYAHALVGAVICLSGLAIQFLGL